MDKKQQPLTVNRDIGDFCEDILWANNWYCDTNYVCNKKGDTTVFDYDQRTSIEDNLNSLKIGGPPLIGLDPEVDEGGEEENKEDGDHSHPPLETTFCNRYHYHHNHPHHHHHHPLESTFCYHRQHQFHRRYCQHYPLGSSPSTPQTHLFLGICNSGRTWRTWAKRYHQKLTQTFLHKCRNQNARLIWQKDWLGKRHDITWIHTYRAKTSITKKLKMWISISPNGTTAKSFFLQCDLVGPELLFIINKSSTLETFPAVDFVAAIACLSDLDDIFYPPLESLAFAEMLRSARQLGSTKSIPVAFCWRHHCLTAVIWLSSLS